MANNSAPNNTTPIGFAVSLLDRCFSCSKIERIRFRSFFRSYLEHRFVRLHLFPRDRLGTSLLWNGKSSSEGGWRHSSCCFLQSVHSRVARLCQHDDGTLKFSDTFRSFSKVRFLCAKKVKEEITAFEYNELQSIFFDRSSRLIYGAFNLPK